MTNNLSYEWDKAQCSRNELWTNLKQQNYDREFLIHYRMTLCEVQNLREKHHELSIRKISKSLEDECKTKIYLPTVPGFADARHEAAGQEDAVGGGEGLHRHHGENHF